nr:GNAT family N-acetyltransferase [Catenulispora pinisilvae]
MTLSLADKPVLPGGRVTLRPVTVEDVPGRMELLADPESSRLTATRVEPSREPAERWYATRAEHEDRLDLAVVANETGEYVGEVVLNDLSVEDRSCGFRICLLAPPRLRTRLRHRGDAAGAAARVRDGRAASGRVGGVPVQPARPARV